MVIKAGLKYSMCRPSMVKTYIDGNRSLIYTIDLNADYISNHSAAINEEHFSVEPPAKLKEEAVERERCTSQKFVLTPLGTSKAGEFFDAAGMASAIYGVKRDEWMCTSPGR